MAIPTEKSSLSALTPGELEKLREQMREVEDNNATFERFALGKALYSGYEKLSIQKRDDEKPIHEFFGPGFSTDVHAIEVHTAPASPSESPSVASSSVASAPHDTLPHPWRLIGSNVYNEAVDGVFISTTVDSPPKYFVAECLSFRGPQASHPVEDLQSAIKRAENILDEHCRGWRAVAAMMKLGLDAGSARIAASLKGYEIDDGNEHAADKNTF